MFGFLGFILIIILFIAIIVLAVLGNIIRAIFGFGKRVPKQNSYTSSNETKQTSSSDQGKKKIFADNEGEYVEFEEVN